MEENLEESPEIVYTDSFIPTDYGAIEYNRAQSFLKDQTDKWRQKLKLNTTITASINSDSVAVDIKLEELNKDITSLNKEQRLIFDITVAYLLTEGTENRKRLKMFVSGPGGTGKSFLINVIVRWCRYHFGDTGGRVGPVGVMAPTGQAAVNVNGGTIHSMLHYGWEKQNQKKSKEDRKKEPTEPNVEDILQKEYANSVKIFIADEISMIGDEDMYKMHHNISKIFPERKSESFGRVHIIFLGDFYQLRPVAKNSLFNLKKSADPEVVNYWIQPKDLVVFLTQQLRHIVEPEETIPFSKVNIAARTGDAAQEHIDCLNTRAIVQPNQKPWPLEIFASLGVSFGVYTNATVTLINANRLKAERATKIIVWARHTTNGAYLGDRKYPNKALFKSGENKKMKLPVSITLCKGAPVLIHRNVCVQAL